MRSGIGHDACPNLDRSRTRTGGRGTSNALQKHVTRAVGADSAGNQRSSSDVSGLLGGGAALEGRGEGRGAPAERAAYREDHGAGAAAAAKRHWLSGDLNGELPNTVGGRAGQ